jgi:uncharacterized protein (DUF1330 family)
VTLVVTLRVRRDRLEDFRAFERHAAAVMAEHGGRIERTVVAAVEGRADLLAEVHVVTFPGEAAFAAYRADPRLRAFAHLRDGAVVATEVLVGEDGPSYSPR